jgi:hypothetical protein
MAHKAKPGNPYRKQCETIRRLWQRDKEELFGIERWVLLGLAVGLLLLPAMLVRLVGGWFGYRGRKLAIDAWAVGKPTALLALLLLRLSWSPWVAVAALIALADLYAYLLGLVFLRRYYTSPASYGRSVLLLGVNFVEATLAFAILYLNTGALSQASAAVHSWHQAVYFSVITAATVGYGDIVPCTSIGRLLVVVQVLTSLLFVAVVLSTFVSNLAALRETRANMRLHPTAAGTDAARPRVSRRR